MCFNDKHERVFITKNDKPERIIIIVIVKERINECIIKEFFLLSLFNSLKNVLIRTTT